MQWDEMNDKEKVRLLLEPVMGCFVLETTATGWRTAEFPKGRNAPPGFHWPIAFWNTDAEVWVIKETGDESLLFDPLHDLNDAWLVVREMNSPIDGSYDRYAAFIMALEKIIGSNLFFDLFYCDPASDECHLTPERTCQAALQAVGAE